MRFVFVIATLFTINFIHLMGKRQIGPILKHPI